MLKRYHPLEMDSYFEDSTNKWDESDAEPQAKRRKSTDSFLLFCKIILEYERYKPQDEGLENFTKSGAEKSVQSHLYMLNPELEKSVQKSSSQKDFLVANQNEEEHDSVFSSNNSTKTDCNFSTESNSSFSSISSNDEHRNGEKISDKESEHLITCYCMKPFAGRPMIECTECQTWIHMSCANVRRKNIPEVFICQQCREATGSARRSQRIRGDYRRILSHIF